MSRFDFLKNKYAQVGFWGTLVAALCCFTPLLVWGFAATGLSALLASKGFWAIAIGVLAVSIGLYWYFNLKNSSSCTTSYSEKK